MNVIILLFILTVAKLASTIPFDREIDCNNKTYVCSTYVQFHPCVRVGENKTVTLPELQYCPGGFVCDDNSAVPCHRLADYETNQKLTTATTTVIEEEQLQPRDSDTILNSVKVVQLDGQHVSNVKVSTLETDIPSKDEDTVRENDDKSYLKPGSYAEGLSSSTFRNYVFTHDTTVTKIPSITNSYNSPTELNDGTTDLPHTVEENHSIGVTKGNDNPNKQYSTYTKETDLDTEESVTTSVDFLEINLMNEIYESTTSKAYRYETSAYGNKISNEIDEDSTNSYDARNTIGEDSEKVIYDSQKNKFINAINRSDIYDSLDADGRPTTIKEEQASMSNYAEEMFSKFSTSTQTTALASKRNTSNTSVQENAAHSNKGNANESLTISLEISTNADPHESSNISVDFNINQKHNGSSLSTSYIENNNNMKEDLESGNGFTNLNNIFVETSTFTLSVNETNIPQHDFEDGINVMVIEEPTGCNLDCKDPLGTEATSFLSNNHSNSVWDPAVTVETTATEENQREGSKEGATDTESSQTSLIYNTDAGASQLHVTHSTLSLTEIKEKNTPLSQPSTIANANIDSTDVLSQNMGESTSLVTEHPGELHFGNSLHTKQIVLHSVLDANSDGSPKDSANSEQSLSQSSQEENCSVSLDVERLTNSIGEEVSASGNEEIHVTPAILPENSYLESDLGDILGRTATVPLTSIGDQESKRNGNSIPIESSVDDNVLEVNAKSIVPTQQQHQHSLNPTYKNDLVEEHSTISSGRSNNAVHDDKGTSNLLPIANIIVPTEGSFSDVNQIAFNIESNNSDELIIGPVAVSEKQAPPTSQIVSDVLRNENEESETIHSASVEVENETNKQLINQKFISSDLQTDPQTGIEVVEINFKTAVVCEDVTDVRPFVQSDLLSILLKQGHFVNMDSAVINLHQTTVTSESESQSSSARTHLNKYGFITTSNPHVAETIATKDVNIMSEDVSTKPPILLQTQAVLFAGLQLSKAPSQADMTDAAELDTESSLNMKMELETSNSATSKQNIESSTTRSINIFVGAKPEYATISSSAIEQLVFVEGGTNIENKDIHTEPSIVLETETVLPIGPRQNNTPSRTSMMNVNLLELDTESNLIIQSRTPNPKDIERVTTTGYINSSDGTKAEYDIATTSSPYSSNIVDENIRTETSKILQITAMLSIGVQQNNALSQTSVMSADLSESDRKGNLVTKEESRTPNPTTSKEDVECSDTISDINSFDGTKLEYDFVPPNPQIDQTIPTKSGSNMRDDDIHREPSIVLQTPTTLLAVFQQTNAPSQTSMMGTDTEVNSIIKEESEPPNPATSATTFMNNFDSAKPQYPSTTTTSSHTGPTIIATTLPIQSTIGTVNLLNDSMSEFICESDGKFPDPNDCSVYHLCVNIYIKYLHVLKPCPPNTLYDPTLRDCTRKPVQCSADSTLRCTSNGVFPHPTDCNRYYKCFWRSLYKKFMLWQFRCPPGMKYDTHTRLCVNVEPLAQCGDLSDAFELPFYCMESGRFPMEYNCEGYYECKEKKGGFQMKVKICSNGKLFDRELGTCRKSELVFCPYEYDNLGNKSSEESEEEE